MRVPGLETQPVHGRQVADRVARMRVHDELCTRGRARGEVEEHRVVGSGRAVGRETRDAAQERIVAPPALRRRADGDALDFLDEPGEFRGVAAVRDEIFGLAAHEPVGDVGRAQLRHRGDEHEAELHRREHCRPQFWTYAEHHQEPVAALGPERAKADGEARGLLRKRGEAPCLDAIANHRERGPCPMLARRELGVEPVERPVEPLGPRPGKGGSRGVIVVAELQEEIARLAERRRL